MRETADELREIINEFGYLLSATDDQRASEKPLPEKWSKKEILGHLIDSACNNHQKFVRTIAENRVRFVGYRQNEWVDAQKYHAASWGVLVTLWQVYNLHLAHLIENVAPEALGNEIIIETAGTFTLEFIMKDYVEHLKHHLSQILPDAGITNNFQNIYNT